MWNFQTEYQKLYIAKKMLEKELDQVAQVFEIQTHQQKIINQGLSLKHPDTFIFEDSIRKARFESMESEIHSSQIRIDLGKATENIIQQTNMMKEESEMETKSRNIRYPKRKHIALKSP